MRRLRTALAAAALGAVTLLATPGAASAAIPMCPQDSYCMYDYYADSTFTTRVGYTDRDCLGNTVTRGTVTRWMTLTTRPCQ